MSVYDKDISKIWFILLMTIFFSIMLIEYSYSYTDKEDINDKYLSIIYNTGLNNCMLDSNSIYDDIDGINKGVKCRFTVMGYNYTNNDLKYNINIKSNENNNINSKLVKMSLINKKNNIKYGPFSAKNIELNNNIKEIVIKNNNKVFDEYELTMWISKDELFNSNYLDENSRFEVNINVLY